MRSLALLGLLLVIGCAGRATSAAEGGASSSGASGSAGGGSGGALSASGGAAAAGAVGNAAGGSSAGGGGAGVAGQGPCPPLECPSPFFGIQLLVTSSAGGPLMAVQGTLSGPLTIQLSCSTVSNGATCFPTQGGPAGSYSLQIVAPGFAALTTTVTATYTPTTGCGCSGATLAPSTVTLNPLRL